MLVFLSALGQCHLRHLYIRVRQDQSQNESAYIGKIIVHGAQNRKLVMARM